MIEGKTENTSLKEVGENSTNYVHVVGDLEKQPESILTYRDDKGDIVTTETKQEELSQEEILSKYVNDEKIKQQLRDTALDFEQKFNGNWFTIDKIVKKTHLKDPRAVNDILQLLIFAEFCGHKVDEKGVRKFKVTLSPIIRLQTLEEELDAIKAEEVFLLGLIENKKKNIVDKIEKLKKEGIELDRFSSKK